MSVGLKVFSGLGSHTMAYLDEVVEPFDSIWFPDHLQSNQGDVMEGWTTFTFALSRYPDKVVGHQVLCDLFRSPTLLAKMMASAQVLSGGRVVMGIGAGWHAEEAHAYGFDFPDTRMRVERLDETIQVVKSLWSQDSTTFEGRHHRVAGARCLPRPDPEPPIMIGGSGERHVLRVVAQHADWWNHIYRDPHEYQRKQAALRRHCDEVGRDYGTITQVLAAEILIGETEQDVRRMQDSDSVRPVDRNGLAGTPDQIAEALMEGIERGADRITVGFADSPEKQGSELFAATVLADLRSKLTPSPVLGYRN